MAAEVAEGVVRERVVVHGAGGWGGRANPSRRSAWKVRCMRFVGGEERMVVVGRKGRETNPPKTIPGMECSHSLHVVGTDAVEGSDAWLQRSRTRPGRFNNQE